MGTIEASTRLSSWIFWLMARIATVSTVWSVESMTLPCQSTLSMAIRPPRRTSLRAYS